MALLTRLLGAAAVGVVGYAGYLYWDYSQQEVEDFAGLICDDAMRECVDQNWGEQKRGWWYTVSQGSRLYPASWWSALEVADSDTKFASDAHLLDSLAYLPNMAGESRAGLPLGFTLDHDDTGRSRIMCDTFPETCAAGTMEEPWVGLNCSACHTNDIKFGDKTVRVEGAPTMADFQALEETLHAATKATLEDAEKFSRFAANVLGESASEEALASLRKQVQEQSDWQARLEDKNATPGYRYGHGRLDAQGHILNKVALLQGNLNDGKAIVHDKPELFDPPFEVLANAPSSYPHIWNTSQQTFIQWNGIATNTARISLGLAETGTGGMLRSVLGWFGLSPDGARETDPGALIRNVSEVIGVFAHIEAHEGDAKFGYKSTLRLKNMIDLEQELMSLHSPQWPASFPEIDQEAADRGQALFVQKCASCHEHLEHDDMESQAKEDMHPIMIFDGNERVAATTPPTDPLLVCNSYYHGSKAGNLAGQNVFLGLKGMEIAETDVTRNMLVNATFGTIIGKADKLIESALEDTFGFGAPRVGGLESAPLPSPIKYMPGVEDADMQAFVKMCMKESSRLSGFEEAHILSYKARPLNGIWATAPYLHNGSVPTLYDLLLPSDMQVTTHHAIAVSDKYRPRSFGLGSRQFDPVKVGFVTDPEQNPFVFQTHDENGRPIPGNYNSGHDYGNADLSEQDRRDLVEYMKRL